MSEPSWTPESWGPNGSERASERLPRLEDLPVAPEGYDQEAVRRAFDDFYRHAAQLDATLQVLESVEAFGRQARDLRADIRSLRSSAWGPLPDLTSTWRTASSTTRRTLAEPAGGVMDALPRVLLEAAFIILVAVGTAFADVKTVWVVALIAAAFLLVALFEVAVSAARPPRAPLVMAPPAVDEHVVVAEEPVVRAGGAVENDLVEIVSEVEAEEEAEAGASAEPEDEPAESEPIVAAALAEVVELEPQAEAPEPLAVEAPLVEDERAHAASAEAEVEENEPIGEAAAEGELNEPSLVAEDADEAFVEPESLEPAAEVAPEPAHRGWRFWRGRQVLETPAEPDAVHRSHVRVLGPEPKAEDEGLEQPPEPVEEEAVPAQVEEEAVLAQAEEGLPDPEPVVPAELIEVDVEFEAEPPPPEPGSVSHELDGWPSPADFEPRVADEETGAPESSEDTLLHLEGLGPPEENGSAVETPLEPVAEDAAGEPAAVFGWQQEPDLADEPQEHRPGRRWFRRRRSGELSRPAQPLDEPWTDDEPEAFAAPADEAPLVAAEHENEPRAGEPEAAESSEEMVSEAELEGEDVVLVGRRREPPTASAASLRRGRR